MGSQMLLTYFSVLNLGDVQISPLLSRMWGAVVISVPLYFMQCSSAWPKPSVLAEMDAEQHPHWSANTVHNHCKHFLPKSPSPEFRKVSSLCTCSKYGLKIPHVLSSWSGEKYRGWQVMPAQNFGHVCRDTLHYSPNQVSFSSIPGSNRYHWNLIANWGLRAFISWTSHAWWGQHLLQINHVIICLASLFIAEGWGSQWKHLVSQNHP